MATGAFAQCVSHESVLIRRVDRVAACLTLRMWPDGRPADATLVAEEQARSEHELVVTGLRPATRYRYRLEGAGAAASEGSFRTAPIDDRAPVRFAAVGDSGDLPWWYNMHRIGWSHIRPLLAWTETPMQWRVAEAIAAGSPDFFVHLGDIVYWRQIRDAHAEAFFRPFAPVLRDAALFAIVGNHDLPRDGGAAPFETIFRNPAPQGIGRPQRNFSTAWGSVRIVALDEEDPGFETSPVLDWFRGELERATEPWLVVVVHRPCFSAYRPEDAFERDTLWPLLQARGVDLVLSGDDHHYARFRRTSELSPVQLIAGGGGKSLYEFKTGVERLEASARTWSFVEVEANGLQLRVRARGLEGKVLDEFVIDRRQGELPANIRSGRRARIERLRQ